MQEKTFSYPYRAIGEILVQQGVDSVFTLMSGETIGLLTNLAENYDDEVDMLYTRHESGAVSMADGYARATDEIGVCVIGRGPALSNATTSLIQARKRGSKVLLLVPKAPLAPHHHKPGKQFDQTGLLQTAVGGPDSYRDRYSFSDQVIDIDSHETLVSDFEEVFRRLRSEGGPIVVQIPVDVLNGEGEIVLPAGGTGALELSTGSTGIVTPTAEQLEEALELYVDSAATHPPVIIAGRGAVQADAKAEILEFAERTNAMLTTTMQSRGLFSGHPYSLGVVGHYGSQLANRYASASDYIIGVGCSLNRHTTNEERLLGAGPERSTVVHVDADSDVLGRYTPVDVGLHGDAKLTLQAMNERLEEMAIDRGDEFWNERTRRRVENAKPYLNPEDFETEEDRIDPRHAITFMNDVVPEDRIVIHDTGHHQFWALDGMEIYNPGDFIWGRDFGGVGESVKLAIGAARDASRTCVLICGDAGFMMSLPEVETAARHEIPIVVAVMNDRALGAEYVHVVDDQLTTAGSQIETPDLGTVAESLGADGYTVRQPEELESLADELSSTPDGPVVINFEVMRDVPCPRSPSG